MSWCHCLFVDLFFGKRETSIKIWANVIEVTPEDEFLFLGCDGIFELNSNQALVFFRGNEWHVMWVAVGVFGVLLVDGHGFATIDLKLMIWDLA